MPHVAVSLPSSGVFAPAKMIWASLVLSASFPFRFRHRMTRVETCRRSATSAARSGPQVSLSVIEARCISTENRGIFEKEHPTEVSLPSFYALSFSRLHRNLPNCLTDMKCSSEETAWNFPVLTLNVPATT